MGYTALKMMQEHNKERYGLAYPTIPEDYRDTENISNY